MGFHNTFYHRVNREAYITKWKSHGKRLMGSIWIKLASWSPVKIKLFSTDLTQIRGQRGWDDLKWYIKGFWYNSLKYCMKSSLLFYPFRMVANCSIIKEFKEKIVCETNTLSAMVLLSAKVIICTLNLPPLTHSRFCSPLANL